MKNVRLACPHREETSTRTTRSRGDDATPDCNLNLRFLEMPTSGPVV
ncbi:MAG: hypothetical protein R3B81_09185 [bacterium]